MTTSSLDWTAMAVKAAAYIYGLHQWSESQKIKIGDKTCQVQAKGRLHELKWVWDGKCECNNIVGESRHYDSKEGAITNAIQDYIVKAGQAGLLTHEQIQQWENNDN
ncbi:unnamed protein product [Rotaria sordida]|uniref:Uncharacterized protein n=1 Tax=Rotaria sordida TaxID=392033 RepID=A0A815VH62_9BILA|nr:unnamed protein product [Rotaria sordida]